MVATEFLTSRPRLLLLLQPELSGYRTLLFSSEGELAGSHFFRADGDLLYTVAELQDIATRHHDVASGGVPERTRHLGQLLYNTVMPESTRSLLHRLRHEGGYSLELVIEAAQLRDVPWSCLHDQRSFLGLSSDTPLSIALSVYPGQLREQADGPLRVLFAGTQPLDVAPLGLQHEAEVLSRRLARPIQEGRIDIDMLASGQLSLLEEKLSKDSYEVVHLSGHGSIDRSSGLIVLTFEGADGKGVQVSLLEVIELFKTKAPDLLFLSNCYSAVAGSTSFHQELLAGLAQAGVSHVVGMRGPILDKAATILAGEVYAELAKGGALDTSMNRGRARLYHELGDLSWTIPVVIATGAGMRLAFKTRPGVRESSAVRTYYQGVRDPGPAFVGRELESRRLRATILGDTPHVMLVAGSAGVGKSALAVQVVRHVETEFDYVAGLNCGTARTIEDLRTLLDDCVSTAGWSSGSAEFLRATEGERVLLLLDGVDGMSDQEIEELARSTPEHVTLVMTRRRSLGIGATESIATIGLDELTSAEFMQFAASNVGLSSLGSDELRDVFERVGGHPAVLVQLGDEIERGDGDEVVRGLLASLPNASTRLTAAVRRLRRSSRRVLAQLGLARVSLPVEVVNRVLNDDCEVAVEDLETAGFVRRHDRGMLSAHRLAGEAAVQLLPSEERRELARAVAQELLKLSADRADIRYAAVALSLGETARSAVIVAAVLDGLLRAGLWRDASRLAARIGDDDDGSLILNREYVSFLQRDRAEARLPTTSPDGGKTDIDLLLLQSILVQRVDDALSLARKCIHLSREAEHWSAFALATVTACESLLAVGDIGSAMAVADECLGRMEEVGSPDRVLVLSVLAHVRLRSGELRIAHELLDRALSITQQAGASALSAAVMHNLAIVQAVAGQLLGARDLFADVAAFWSRVGNTSGEARSLSGLGGIALLLGRTAEAQSYLDRSEQQLRRAGRLHEAAQVAVMLDALIGNADRQSHDTLGSESLITLLALRRVLDDLKSGALDTASTTLGGVTARSFSHQWFVLFYRGILSFLRGEIAASSSAFASAVEVASRAEWAQADAYASFGLGVVLSDSEPEKAAAALVRSHVRFDSLGLGATQLLEIVLRQHSSRMDEARFSEIAMAATGGERMMHTIRFSPTQASTMYRALHVMEVDLGREERYGISGENLLQRVASAPELEEVDVVAELLRMPLVELPWDNGLYVAVSRPSGAQSLEAAHVEYIEMAPVLHDYVPVQGVQP